MVTWNTLWPNGARSVSQNTPTGQQNTTYITTVQNYDHFWNTGVDEDGRHRQVSSVAQASDPSIPTGMDGVVYLKEVSADNARVEGFYRNNEGIYQFIPSFKSGTVVLNTSTYSIVDSIPDNSYGQIYIFEDSATAPTKFGVGFFKACDGLTQCYSSAGSVSFGNTANGFSSGLNILALTTPTSSGGTFLYRIVYWGI